MNRFVKILILLVFLSTTGWAQAQQVKTLYWLQNAPMRHLLNPALQPASDFYLALPAIGYTSIWAGNNAMALSDITDINMLPYADGQLWDKLPNVLKLDADAHINLLSIGMRFKNNGYGTLHIGERASVVGVLPKKAVGMILDQDLTNISWTNLSASALMYTDISLGYSHQINHQWSFGAKLKLLLGHAHAQILVKNLDFAASIDQVSLNVNGSQYGTRVITDLLSGKGLSYGSTKELLNAFTPGVGGAVDLGVTYRPIECLEVSASITDLGVIRWLKGKGTSSTLVADTVYTDFSNIDPDDYLNGTTDFDLLTLGTVLEEGVQVTNPNNQSISRMLNANVHLGVDAKFWEDRVGVGVHFNTKFLDQYITEEITLGAFFCPINWFNLAASYSFINGRWSNIGAALGLAPYDGIMLTLSADYVPLSYVKDINTNKNTFIPYKTQGLNLAFGIAIVAGTNKNKKANNIP